MKLDDTPIEARTAFIAKLRANSAKRAMELEAKKKLNYEIELHKLYRHALNFVEKWSLKNVGYSCRYEIPYEASTQSYSDFSQIVSGVAAELRTNYGFVIQLSISHESAVMHIYWHDPDPIYR